MSHRRTQIELERLQRNPINGVQIEEIEPMLWLATIDGPVGTPYAGGKFRLRISFPNEYPFKMPEFKFETQIWYPNVIKKYHNYYDTHSKSA